MSVVFVGDGVTEQLITEKPVEYLGNAGKLQAESKLHSGEARKQGACGVAVEGRV